MNELFNKEDQLFDSSSKKLFNQSVFKKKKNIADTKMQMQDYIYGVFFETISSLYNWLYNINIDYIYKNCLETFFIGGIILEENSSAIHNWLMRPYVSLYVLNNLLKISISLSNYQYQIPNVSGCLLKTVFFGKDNSIFNNIDLKKIGILLDNLVIKYGCFISHAMSFIDGSYIFGLKFASKNSGLIIGGFNSFKLHFFIDLKKFKLNINFNQHFSVYSKIYFIKFLLHNLNNYFLQCNISNFIRMFVQQKYFIRLLLFYFKGLFLQLNIIIFSFIKFIIFIGKNLYISIAFLKNVKSYYFNKYYGKLKKLFIKNTVKKRETNHLFIKSF